MGTSAVQPRLCLDFAVLLPCPEPERDQHPTPASSNRSSRIPSFPRPSSSTDHEPSRLHLLHGGCLARPVVGRRRRRTPPSSSSTPPFRSARCRPVPPFLEVPAPSSAAAASIPSRRPRLPLQRAAGAPLIVVDCSRTWTPAPWAAFGCQGLARSRSSRPLPSHRCLQPSSLPEFAPPLLCFCFCFLSSRAARPLLPVALTTNARASGPNPCLQSRPSSRTAGPLSTSPAPLA